jgi:hypothetical protein
MKRSVVAFACVVVLLTVVHSASAAKCQDIPLRVTLYANAVVNPSTGATTPAAITSDGGGEYTSANIMVCAGTNDAVTNLVTTKRTFTFTFPFPIAGSDIEATPAWVPGSFPVSGWINIRNILFSKGSNQPFATMAGSRVNRSGERTTYRLGFKGNSPDLPNAPNLHDSQDAISADNTPFASSPVIVYPTYPVPCGTGAMPTWLVRGTSPNTPGTEIGVGTLHKNPSISRDSEVHEGQYSMPFEMRIEALKCFTY